MFYESLLFANLRAPVRIEHAPGQLQVKVIPNAKFEVISEILEFVCPESYAGKMDYKHFETSTCDAKIRYHIRADKNAQVKLVFIYSGNHKVAWRIGGKEFISTPQEFSIRDKRLCSFCPDDLRKLYASEQEIPFAAGENTLQLDYLQILNFNETKHGYFTSSQWSQGFSYDLWPIAEWAWAENFKAKLYFSIAMRPGFLGLGYKNDKLACQIADGTKQIAVGLSASSTVGKLRTVTAYLPVEKRSQRLQCSYAAD